MWPNRFSGCSTACGSSVPGRYDRVRCVTRVTELLVYVAAALLLVWFVVPLLLDILNARTP